MITSISKRTLDQLIEKYIHEQKYSVFETINIYIEYFQLIQAEFIGFYKIFLQSGFYCESNDDATSKLLQNFIDSRLISNLYTKCYLTDEQFDKLLQLNISNDNVLLTLEYTHLYDITIQNNINKILSKACVVKQLQNDTTTVAEHQNNKLQFLYYNIFDISDANLSQLTQLIICNFRIRTNHKLSYFLLQVPHLLLLKLDKCHIRESDFDVQCIKKMYQLKYMSFYGNQLGFDSFSELILHIFTGKHQIRHFNISNNNIFKGVSTTKINSFTQQLLNMYKGFSNAIIHFSDQQLCKLFENQKLDFKINFNNYVTITPKTCFELLIDGIGVGEVKKANIQKQQRCILIGVVIAGFIAGFELKLSSGGIVLSAISDIVDGLDAESFIYVINGIECGMSTLGISKTYVSNSHNILDCSSQNTHYKNEKEHQLIQFHPKITSLQLQSNQLACKGPQGSKYLSELLQYLIDDDLSSQQDALSFKQKQNSSISSIFTLQSLNLSNTDIFHGWLSRNTPSAHFLTLLERCGNIQELHINSENPKSSQLQLIERLKSRSMVPKLDVFTVDEFLNLNEAISILQARWKETHLQRVEWKLNNLEKIILNFFQPKFNQINMQMPYTSGRKLYGISQLSCKWSEKRLKSLKALIEGFRNDASEVLERVFNSRFGQIVKSFLFAFDYEYHDLTEDFPQLQMFIVDNSLSTSFFDIDILQIQQETLRHAKKLCKEKGLQFILQFMGCQYDVKDIQNQNEQFLQQNDNTKIQYEKTSPISQNEQLNCLKTDFSWITAIQYFSQLKILSVSGCKLLKQQIHNFASLVAANKQLRFLDVSRCSLTDATAKIVIDAFMEKNRVIRFFGENKSLYIFLDKNQLGEATFITIKENIIKLESEYCNNMHACCFVVFRLTNIKYLSIPVQTRILSEIIKIQYRFLTIICQFERNLLKNFENTTSFMIIKQGDILKGQCIDFNDIVKKQMSMESQISFNHMLNLQDVLLYNLE